MSEDTNIPTPAIALTHWPGEMLVFYDGPEVYVVHDSDGGMHIGTRIVTGNSAHNCLAAEITTDQLIRFKDGRSDLRETILSARAWRILTQVSGGFYVDCRLREPVEEILPLAGFFLNRVSDRSENPAGGTSRNCSEERGPQGDAQQTEPLTNT